MPRLLRCVWISAVLACAPPIAHAPERDANSDAPYAPGDPRVIGGVTTGGGGGGTDSGTTSGCAARILVIFDRSGSMATEWMGATMSGPRWQVAEMAITAAVQPHESQLTVGAILFPSADTDPMGMTCSVVDPIAEQIPFESGTEFLSRWASTWSSPDLLGSTPIDSAFDAADAALTGAGAETAVVLLTDGEPTCTGAVDAGTRAASWHTRGINTYVVGLPGSSAGEAYLDGIASAGGTSSPISVDDPSALGTALVSIAGTHVQNQCGS